MPHPDAKTIEDLLSDSLIQTVMRADRVDPRWLKALLEKTARNLSADRRSAALTPISTRLSLGKERRALPLAPQDGLAGRQTSFCGCA